MSSLPPVRDSAPLTMDRLVPLFEDMKDFVKASIKASETALRGEMQALHAELKLELKLEIKGLRQAIHVVDQKVEVLQLAVTAHTKHLKAVETTVGDHESRLTRLEQHAPSSYPST